MMRTVEFRSYRLKPGTGPSFHELIAHQSVSLMCDWGMDVVASNPSADDPDAYLLIRAYDSIEHLRASQEAFYASEVWRQGPREAVLACIDGNINVLLELSEAAVNTLSQDAAN